MINVPTNVFLNAKYWTQNAVDRERWYKTAENGNAIKVKIVNNA